MMLESMPHTTPPPVTELPTAIALFVGYTETAVRDGQDLTNTPTRVGSLAEYEKHFGGDFTLTTGAIELARDRMRAVTVTRLSRPFLYDSIRLFFDNGGRACWIVSIGRYGKAADRGALKRGLETAAACDEPAILAVPDAAALASPEDRYAVQRSMLAQCAARANRFAILDLANASDPEWRYVPVRRFVAMVEASIEQSTQWVVFEPNAAPLWAAVRGQAEDYLIQKWRDGALVGAKADEAFFVRVGAGQTMTSRDVLEGRLVIEIGLAVVRPAEFIILRVERIVQRP
jgi:phage tail sheath protein FI